MSILWSNSWNCHYTHKTSIILCTIMKCGLLSMLIFLSQIFHLALSSSESFLVPLQQTKSKNNINLHQIILRFSYPTWFLLSYSPCGMFQGKIYLITWNSQRTRTNHGRLIENPIFKMPLYPIGYIYSYSIELSNPKKMRHSFVFFRHDFVVQMYFHGVNIF